MSILHAYLLTFLSILSFGVSSVSALFTHRDDPAATGTSASWVATSIPPAPGYASTSAPATADAPHYGFASSSTLPAFVVATGKPAKDTSGTTQPQTAGALDQLHAYIASLTTGPAQTSAPIDLSSLYANLAPQATTPSAPAHTETPEQTALHAYGNAAGAIITALESADPNQNDVLSAFFKSPGIATAAPVARIAARLTAAGSDLQQMTGIPSSMRERHAALAGAYVHAGELLAALSATRTDNDLLSAINAYNGSVQSLGNAFTDIVVSLQEAGVTFTQDESGSAFSFTGSL